MKKIIIASAAFIGAVLFMFNLTNQAFAGEIFQFTPNDTFELYTYKSGDKLVTNIAVRDFGFKSQSDVEEVNDVNESEPDSAPSTVVEQIPVFDDEVMFNDPEVIYLTAEDFTGDEELKKKLEGTDEWNELIYTICEEEGIDPIFVKCLMAQESVGKLTAKRVNDNGSTDYGLMQINSSNGNKFDYNKILKDGEYAIRCGIEVIKEKVAICENLGIEANYFNIAWCYNGYNKHGKAYASTINEYYEGLTGEDLSNILY